MTSKLHHIFEAIDPDFGLIHGKSKRNKSVLWNFTSSVQDQSVEVFIEGTEKKIHSINKDILKRFLQNSHLFEQNLENELDQRASENNFLYYFRNQSYTYSTISIWSHTYDITLLSANRQYEPTASL